MPTPESTVSSVSSIESELYFLIARFLSSGPCKKASDVLLQELKEHQLLPKRIDWEGRDHYRSYPDLIEIFRHISKFHLLNICERLGPLLDKEVPPTITGVRSLLGAGSLSLLRTVENSKKTKWFPSQLVVLHHAEPLLPPRNIANITACHMMKAREMGGRGRRDLLCPYQQYSHVSLHDRKLGHLSAVYCVSFDRTGQYIMTGADDHLVKIWSAASGRLLATLRGHSAEITDLAINYENTLLAAGSCDKLIRVWCLRTKAPVAVLHGHAGMITSVQFCPQVKGETRYLGTTGADGCVCFWPWNVVTLKFNPKPIKFVERSRAGAQMLCSSFSPGGLFLATGNSDNVIRVYFFHSTNPEKICELEAHKDRVDSITYSNLGMRFVSGSKDGTARIWRYERQEWKAIVLNMSTKLQGKTAPMPDSVPTDENKKDKLRVTMVGWTMNDEMVITAVSDYTLKVWNSYTGKLLQVLESHQDEVFVLETSPVDPRILLSAGHDGNVVIWDIQTGTKIKSFFNMIQGQGHGAVFDCKFSPDGLSFAAVDSHGHLLMFGFGTNEKFQKIPKEVFFHTDYRPLIRDANNFVLDEQTQQAPHLMPPPFLVDIDGNPYPPPLQRLVPGRQNCKDNMLIPEVAYNEEGSSEVIGDGEVADSMQAEAAAPVQRERPSLDHLIQQLQREQDHRIAQAGGEPLASPPPVGSPPLFVSPRSHQGRIGMRRSGETEGVRQSLGNVSLRATKSDIAAIRRRVVVRPLDLEVLLRAEERRMGFADEEFKKFVFERKKKPNSPHSTTSHSAASKSKSKKTSAATSTPAENEETARNLLITRALYDTEDEEEEDGNSSASDFLHDSDTSEYSDWMGDTGSNLQPPKRTSQRQRKRKRLTSTEDDDDLDDEDMHVDVDSKDNDQDSGSDEESKPRKSKPPPKKKKKPAKKPSKMPDDDSELLEIFRPPEWLTDTIPRKAPFVPQMGDEVMYFRQGHEAYLNAVKKHKVYEVNLNNNQPWHKMPNLREQELVKIVGIRYEIRPPRLCCLKLAFIDPENGKLTGGNFSIRYHDMPDVIDFLVLRQTYNLAMKRKWKPKNRFRAMIDDHWWMGTIESQEPFQAEFPDSMYQCFNVHWDNEEYEKLSPWDLEPIDDEVLSGDVGGGVPVEKEELTSLLYNPVASEWPPRGQEEECDRLVHGLEMLMQHSIAEPFNAPVDLNLFPSYARFIEYPVDLSTIKARLENRFYRRFNAVQFDVRHIEQNARKFNEPKSAIVRKAAILYDTLLKLISDTDCYDPMPILSHFMDKKNMNNTTSESEEEASDDTASSNKRKKTNKGKSKKRHCPEKVDPNLWKEQCGELIVRMVECEDSNPFRFAVDPEIYPDYYKFVENPMDFGQVKENLANQGYTTPVELCRDVRLIFHNSKSYNTNKKSRIYAMTLRLSAMFEDQIRDIIFQWKSGAKSKPTSKPPLRSNTKVTNSSFSTSARERATNSSSDSSQPSTSNVQGTLRVTRSRGGGDRGSADGYSSGPTMSTRPRRSVQTPRYTGRKVIGSDGESEEDDDTEDVEMDEEEKEEVNVEEEEEEEQEEEEEVPVAEVRRSSSRKKATQRVVESEDESEEEEPRPRTKAKPKRANRSSGKASNGYSKPSYRTRASTGKAQPAKYMADESSSLVSKSESPSTASSNSPSHSIGSGDANGSSSSSSSERGEETDEDKNNHSDYSKPRTSRRTMSKPKSRSIQKQVEIVRHSQRERRKVQDSNFVYEPKRTTRNQGRRTVQYQEEDSDNERLTGRNGVANNSDNSDSDSDSDSNENRSSPDTQTMSSRGRIRKLTPRARASLYGD